MQSIRRSDGLILAQPPLPAELHGSDDALRLTPPRQMSLEQCLEFLADDELLEVTPENLRLRKRILSHADRMKALKGGK